MTLQASPVYSIAEVQSGVVAQITPQPSPTYVISTVPIVGSDPQAATQTWVDTYYYPRSNPSGCATGIDESLYISKSESGQFVTTGNTGAFITTGQRVITTADTGNFSVNNVGLETVVTMTIALG